MEKAIESLEKKEMSGTAAAEFYNVPRSTLFDYLRYRKKRRMEEQENGKEEGKDKGKDKEKKEKTG